MDPLTVLPYFQALIVLSFVTLVVGLIRPDWVFFWMKSPNRHMIVAFSIALFMLAMIGYGEVRNWIDAEQKTEKPAPAARPEKPRQ